MIVEIISDSKSGPSTMEFNQSQANPVLINTSRWFGWRWLQTGNSRKKSRIAHVVLRYWLWLTDDGKLKWSIQLFALSNSKLRVWEPSLSLRKITTGTCSKSMLHKYSFSKLNGSMSKDWRNRSKLMSKVRRPESRASNESTGCWASTLPTVLSLSPLMHGQRRICSLDGSLGGSVAQHARSVLWFRFRHLFSLNCYKY